MKITLVEIEQINRFQIPELQQRALQIALSKKTICYLALCGNREVAFVALDRWPEPEFDRLVVYELFVPQHLRMQGFGSAVLSQIERIAEREKFSAVRLIPRPLDDDISGDVLNKWYHQRGYQFVPSPADEMEKRVLEASR